MPQAGAARTEPRRVRQRVPAVSSTEADDPAKLTSVFLEKDEENNVYPYQMEEGYRVDQAKGLIALGLFKDYDDIRNSPRQDFGSVQPGDIKYKDVNNDGVINDKDRTWIGNPNPSFTYGLSINLSYKNFDISTFWQGVADVDIINAKKYQTDFWSVDDVGSNKGTRLLNAWSPENPNSNIPAVTTVDSNAESRFSTYYVENGSYLKLRVLQIGYTLPKSVSDNYGISNFRLYTSVQNLWTIKSKNFTGVDPETPAFGYPLPLTVNFGINISL